VSITSELSADGRVATWWLDRVESRNAISLDMWKKLNELSEVARANGEIRVLVIRGRGGHFSSGADIANLGRTLAADHDGSNYRAVNAAAEHAIASLPFPTIAAIEGFCVGGGVQIALACDLRVASTTAQFGVTPARLGIAYPAAALQRLVATVGTATSREILFLADIFDASTALNWGLINSVHEDLDLAIDQLLTTLISRSAFSQSAAKAVLNHLVEARDVSELGAALELASLDSADLTEGLAAFSAKRSPNFGARS
jgi:1,4-dihydroxy-2-naphthoyl-CoA synthase